MHSFMTAISIIHYYRNICSQINAGPIAQNADQLSILSFNETSIITIIIETHINDPVGRKK